MRDVVLLIIVSLATLATLRRPLIGVLTYAFLSVFSPQSFTWGFARTLPFSQLIVVSTILGIFISGDRKAFIFGREISLLVLLWIAFGVSTLAALYPESAFERYLYVSKVFFMLLVSTIVVNSEEKLHSLVCVIGYSLGLYALKAGLFSVVTGGSQTVYGPDSNFLAANNSIGLALAMNIPVLIYLLRKEQKPWRKWLLRTMLLLTYPAIICTYSRGAWIGMVIVTLLSVLKSKKKFVMVTAAGLVVVMLQAILPKISPERLLNRYDELVNYEDEASAQSRFWNWEFCARVGMARPLTGGGFDFYTIESYAKFYPEFQERWPGKVWSCHSMFLTVFGEHGAVGAAIWLALLVSVMLRLRSLRWYGRQNRKQSLIDFVDMAQGALVAYLVVGVFLDAAYFEIFYYLIAFVIIQHALISSALLVDRAAFARGQLNGNLTIKSQEQLVHS
jgi:probable O-glycosylation ligase (exosortase A-associated)